MQQFSQTRNGMKFLSDVGRIATALERLAAAIEAATPDGATADPRPLVTTAEKEPTHE